ncbi:hypothetical protein H0H93_000048 [Arthromyces matolae]|nr:hypothetical protein H0H93_000048 [Arthromyces matolae]
MLYHFVLALPLLPVLHAQVDPSLLNNVTQAFSQAQIVPDVLPFFAPSDLVNLTFPATPSAVQVDVTPGALLPENQTATEPSFSLGSNDTTSLVDETFILVIVDPDAPSSDGTGTTEFLHFLGGNFSVDPTSPDSTTLVNQSAALLEFFPPSPPAGDPPHRSASHIFSGYLRLRSSLLRRYILVVYDQPSGFSENVGALVNATTPRLGFDLLDFAAGANLSDPVAGNFFLVGADNGTSTSTSTLTSAPIESSTSSSANLPTLTAPLSSLPTSSITSTGSSFTSSSATTSETTTSTSNAIEIANSLLGTNAQPPFITRKGDFVNLNERLMVPVVPALSDLAFVGLAKT